MLRRCRETVPAACAFALALALAGTAEAQTDPVDPTAATTTRAQELFEEGRRLYEEKRFKEACERLTESERLDPAVGTLGLLAGCHESMGLFATARREFLTTAERADKSKDERAAFARQRAAALEPRVPKITIRLAGGAAGVELYRDGQLVPASEVGVEIPVDPGPHEISALAPGKKEFRAKVEAVEGARLTVDVALAPLAAPQPAAPPPPPPPDDGTRRTVAYVVGGVGLVGIGLGAAFGVSALGKHVESTTLEETCASAEQCEKGRQLRDSTFTAGTISTIGFGVGIAGLGVATVLLLTADERPARQGGKAATMARVRLTPLAGADGGGAALSGRF